MLLKVDGTISMISTIQFAPLVEPKEHSGGANDPESCLGFDLVQVKDGFLSLATTAIGNDAEAQQFHERYDAKTFKKLAKGL